MNFDKETEDFLFAGGGGGGGERREGKRREVSDRKNITKKNKNNMYSLFVLMLYIKFQIPYSNGSLVLTQTIGVMDR